MQRPATSPGVCCCACVPLVLHTPDFVMAGAASIGVIRVNNMEDLHKAYHRVVKDLSRAKVRWRIRKYCNNKHGDVCIAPQPHQMQP